MADVQQSTAVARVRDALLARGSDANIVVLSQSARTAQAAAEALQCNVAQIAKSLIFRIKDTDSAVLVIASGAHRVDEEKIARALGVEIDKAEGRFVREVTGFAIGGIPPLGHATVLPVLIDEFLLNFPVVWAAAGTPRAVFSSTPAQLVTWTQGRVCAVAVDG